MTVGAVVRREGMLLVVEFFKMERGLGAVVKWLPDRYGIAAMKSLPGESDLSARVVLTLVSWSGVED
jgi:hypothetical protein